MTWFPTRESRLRWERWLSYLVEACLAVCLALLIILYPKSYDFCNNLATLAAICALAMITLRPPADKPVWPYWAFISALVAFYGFNLLSIHLAEEVPGIGHSSSRWVHLPGLVLCLAVGLGVRNQRSAGRLIAVLLLVSGLWYLGELINIPWRSPFLGNRFIGSREYFTVTANELLPLFALFLGSAALVKDRRLALASLSGAVMVGVLLFLTKTRSTLLVMIFVTIPLTVLVNRQFGDRLRKFTGSFRQRLVILGLLVFLVAPAAAAVWYYNASPERRSLINVFSRFSAYKICFQVADKEPWSRIMIGHGRFSHTFAAVARHYQTDSPVMHGEELYHAHNVLLQTFLETGILGTMALVLLVATAFYRALWAWLKKGETFPVVPGVMIVALSTIIVMSQMDYCLQTVPGFLCWFIIGMAFASGTSEEKNSLQEGSD